MIARIKRIIYTMAWVPLAAGIIGYWLVGRMSFADALYSTIALYFINPVTDLHNIWVYISEYSAVLVAATVILDFLVSLVSRMDTLWNLLWRDSTVIYTDYDEDTRKHVMGNFKHGIIADKDSSVRKRARRHIIMYSDDSMNLEFLQNHKSELTGRKVYLVLNEVDASMLNAVNGAEVELHYINRYDLIARKYWKDNNLYDQMLDRGGRGVFRIGIVGFDNVGKAIFKYGYMNNIYSPDQKIEYHIWGVPTEDREFTAKLETMNGDSITIHDSSAIHDSTELAGMDRVIISDLSNRIRLIQSIIYESTSACIHYYSQNGDNLKEMYSYDNLDSFGNMEEVLTEDNIIKEKIYEMGKLINYDYELYVQTKDDADKIQPGSWSQAMDTAKEFCWQKTNGYGRESSIARADHYYIKKRLTVENIVNGDELAELEHIRWCRFLFANHFSYGKEKDIKNRKHNLLVPYSILPEHEKNKDIVNVDIIRDKLDELCDGAI